MLNPNIPLQTQGVQMPNFLAMAGQSQQLKDSRLKHKLTLADVARGKKLDEELSKIDSKSKPMDVYNSMAKSGLAKEGLLYASKLGQMQEAEKRQQYTEEDRNLLEEKRARTIGGEIASRYLKQDPQGKMNNYGQLIEAFQKYRIPLPPTLMEATEYDPMVEGALNLIATEGKRSSASSPASLQEWEAYQQMSPKDKEEFMKLKRGESKAPSDIQKFQYYLENPEILKFLKDIKDLPDDKKSLEWAKLSPEIQAAIESAKVVAKKEAGGEISPKEKQQTGKIRVSEQLKDLKEYYKNLDEIGAIVNKDKDSFENLSNYASSSDVGQAFGRMFGTNAQVIRDKINTLRPTLLNSVRQASEMGAKGMDSEKEMQFFLQAATDPQREISVNLAAIDALDKAYGLGINLKNINQSDVKKLKSQAPKSRRTATMDDF